MRAVAARWGIHVCHNAPDDLMLTRLQVDHFSGFAVKVRLAGSMAPSHDEEGQGVQRDTSYSERDVALHHVFEFTERGPAAASWT